MTAPKAPQWPFTPVLRLAAVALLLASVALVVEGVISTVLWGGSVVFLVLAVVQLAKNWRRRP